MICSLSADDKNYSVYIKLYKYLAAQLNTRINDPEASIRIEDIMKNMYEDVLAKTNDHELAIRFARMVPTAVFNIAGKNMQKIAVMMSKGLDPTATALMASEALNNETGISFVENKLGLGTDIAKKAKNTSEGKSTVKATRKKPVVRNIPEGSVPLDQLALFDEDGNPIEASTSSKKDSKDKSVNDQFEAVAAHALKDTDNEALSMDPESKNFNVPDPAKKMFYKVKRNILNLIKQGTDGSEINYPGVGPLYLQAQNKENIPAKFLPSDPEGLMAAALVIVDRFGDPVYFNEKGEVDKKGALAVYSLRVPHDILSDYEQKRITSLSSQLGISTNAAEDIIMKEREVVNKVIKYVQANVSNNVTMNINGGSFGVYTNAPSPYLMSSINFPTDAIDITKDKKFNYQFTLSSLSDQPIKIQPSIIKDRPEMVDFLASLLVDDIFSGPVLLNVSQKREIIQKYLMVDPFHVSLIKDGPIVGNQLLDVSTPEARAVAKQKVKEALTTLRPFSKPLSSTEVNDLTTSGANVVDSISKGEFGDILLTKDEVTGESIYRKLSYPTLNITDKGLQDKSHYSLQARPDGTMNITKIENGYFNNYIKNNFMIDKLLNADNELVQLNAYFTFAPLESESAKIDNYNYTKDEKEIDYFEKDLIENKKELQEQYDALPAEMKKAIEILNSASESMPISGIAYSLHVSKVFEKNLKLDLYTREEADAIVNYLASKEIMEYVPFKRYGKYNFSGNVLNIAKSNVNRYTKPTVTTQPSTQENTIQIENPLETPAPPISTTEQGRRISSRKADAGTDNIKKDEDNYLGRPKSTDESDEVFNSTIIGRSNGTITQKDIDTARAWYKQLKFKDPKTGKEKYFEEVFPFTEAFNLVNEKDPNVIATWTWNGITLYKGSNHTELYHEAFHGFVNTFLSKQDKDALFAEVTKMTGTFRDFEGKRIPFSLATPKQIEEYLAEQFRAYMISNGRMSIANAPVRKSFFKKLLNILELLFGNLTIAEIYADSQANSKIKAIYENLRKGDLSSYEFNLPDARFNSPDTQLDSTRVQALDSNDKFANLSDKDTKLLIDSIDGWIAQSIESANSDLQTDEAMQDFLKLQVDMMMNRLSPAEMEKQKLAKAKNLTYNQSINYLKTKAGRTQAYKRVHYILSKLQIALNEEYAKLKKESAGENKLQPVREKLGLVMFARDNFGDLTNLSNNKVDKDGVIRGVITLHMVKSKNFSTDAIELLDKDETSDDDKGRSPYEQKSGAEVSQKELASAEVKYLFKTLYRMDPKTRMPLTNDLGAPILMDFDDIFGKVVTILENETDVIKMYEKLLKFAQQENPTEITLAVAQLIGKLGPKGLSKQDFVHLQSRAVEQLWTAFRNTMALARVPLVAQNIEKVTDDKGNTSIKSTVGRGINTYASVGKAWNSKFIWDKSDYVKQVDGVGNVLDIKAVLKKFPDLNSLKTGNKYDVNKVLDFLDAIGINMSRTEEVKAALENGSSELGIGAGINGFRWVETLMSRNSKRVIKDELNQDKYGDKLNSATTTGYSLLEILDKNGIVITKPQDIFEQFKVPLIGGIDRSTGEEVMISGLPGEGANWRELQQIEGQFGSGIPSFMVTTADGNTKFEMSQNSTMSIMVSHVNSAEDTFEEDINGNLIRVSAYDNLIKMPHMAKFDIDKNPNAKRYVWLTNMFNIVDSEGNPISKKDERYGERKTTIGNKKVKLLLHDISGARTVDKDGVSSASADPYTKFILDFHLAVQKGLPELMRHSDKGTSYSVILNYITSPGAISDVTQGQYIPNYRFIDSRESFHNIAFEHYILPNLTSEHNRVRRFMEKKEQINATLKQIAEEKKAGKQITPTPVFDFNYLKNGQKFLMFQGILNAKTKEQLSKVEGDLTEYFKDTTNTAAQKLKDKVIAETRNYFEGQFNEVKMHFDDFGFAADNLLETFSNDIYNRTGNKLNPRINRKELENALLNSWVYNSWVNNAESMNFLYGDIALYIHAKEEFHKRNAGIASTGITFRTDKDYIDFVNNSVYGLGRKFEQQLTGKPMRIYDGTMNTGVMKDKITRSAYLEEIGFNLYNQMVDKAVAVNKNAVVKRSKEEIEKDIKTKLFGASHANKVIREEKDLKDIQPDDKSIMDGYNKMNEADAQGWISFDSYRILMDAQGQWSPSQEKIYLAMLNGEEIPADKIGTFFPPLKVQYWGALANDPNNSLTEDVSIEAFHKFQLTPITPALTNTSPKLKTLHDKMMNEGMDYVLFESGSKVGTLTTVQFDEAGMPIRVNENGKVVKSTDAAYNDNLDIASIKDDIYTSNRDINDDVPFTKNIIHVEFLKNQLNIEPKWKGRVTFPTQIRKLIEVDLMENGIPTDFRINDELESRIEAWLSMSFEDQLKESQNFRDIIEYEKQVHMLTLNRKANLLKKAKLKVNEKGELVGNIENLIKYIKSQLTVQDLADHELDFIDVNFEGKLKHDLSFSLSADKIERLLNALVVKSIIKQKVRGEGLIQVSGAMLEPQFREASEEELKQYGGTNGLKYYTVNKEGNYVNAMKIKIAMQGDFKKLLYLPEVAVFEQQVDPKTGKILVDKNNKPVMKLNENASLVKLNELIKDDNWLNEGNNRKLVSAHGDRIPIQGLNSDEFAEVYEFLPETAGNIIILPAEIVAKSGGDFDIDKLTLIFPNISMSSKMVDGVLQYNVGLYEELDLKQYKEKYKKYKELAAEKILTEEYDNQIDKALAIFTHYKLFGGKEKVDSDIIEILLEEGELLDFEDFVLADQEKVIQNNLLFAMNKLSSKIENYSNLVRPNATDILDPIVSDLKKVYREYDPKLSTNDEANPSKGIQASKIFEITYNLYKQMTNNLGKKALGIGAIDNTYNELFNRIGMYLNADNSELLGDITQEEIEDLTKRAKAVYSLEKAKKQKGSEWTKEEEAKLKLAKSQFTKVDEERLLAYERQTLFMPHNTMFKNKSISLSHRYDALGENKIGDVISQLMNGWVDIAKDPWIFYLKGNDKLGPMLLFLVQAGVPIKHAAYFISQPIITEYMNEVDRLRSVYATAMQSGTENEITRDKAILEAKQRILAKLGVEIETPKSKDDIVANVKKAIRKEMVLSKPEKNMFELDDLLKQLEHANNKYAIYDKNGRPIKKDNLNVDYSDPVLADYQKSVFLHFLQIADMESSLKDVKLRTNVDTGKSGSLYEAQDKIVKLLELKRARNDEGNDSQTQYWRIPSKVIDRLIPTIKDAQGNDTGVLDESVLSSPIASFYQQPFQIEIWKNLFPFRNNSIINKFMIDMSFADKDSAKNNTYFEKDTELMAEFKNALLPIIFQNSFLSVDIQELMTSTKPIYFRGIAVKTARVEALPEWGVAFKDGDLYYDYNTLWEQYNSKSYLRTSPSGVAAINNADTFKTFGEYVKFIFQREYLRSEYIEDTFTKMTELRKSNQEFNDIWKASLTAIDKSDFLEEGQELIRAGESKRLYERARLKYSFEIYLRNRALKDVYNMHALFNSDTAYAFEVFQHKIDKKYGESLVNAFPVLKNLIPDSESSKTTKSERINLAFLDAPKDSETINSYYFQIQSLSNPIAIKKALPEITTEEAEKIAQTFTKLPIVSFLQSGMNTSGRFSLNRIVDNSVVEAMLLPEVDKFLEKIESENAVNSYATLKSMMDVFVENNKRYNGRGKNYVLEVSRDAKPINTLDKKLFIDDVENQKSFDPEFITSDGSISKPYTLVGDRFSFTIDKDNTNDKFNYDNLKVSDITWNGSNVVIEAIQYKKKDNKIEELTHKFFFTIDGKLIKYVNANNNAYIQGIEKINLNDGLIVRPEMLSGIEGFTWDKVTEVGDTVVYGSEYTKDGQSTMSYKDAEIIEIDDMFYNYNRNAQGELFYTSDTPLYRVKIQYSSTYNGKTEVKTANLVVDANGKVFAKFNNNGTLQELNVKSKVYLKLRADRVKGDFIVPNLDTAADMIQRGIIPPGAIIDVIEFKKDNTPETGFYNQSTLYYLDASTMKIKELEYNYTDEPIETKGYDLDATNYFIVYNEAVNSGVSIAATGASSVPLPKGSGVGNINIKDRFVHHSDYQNKAGLISRNKYRGGAIINLEMLTSENIGNQEFFYDDVDATGKYTINPDVKTAIDESIEVIKKMRDDKGLIPVFSKSGYGQYMIGADDTTGKMFKDKNGNNIGIAVAPETFKYLSTRLLEEFGYINPNFVREAEGVKEIVRVVKQPITDEEYSDLMNKCFA